jgi:hypothetical protein
MKLFYLMFLMLFLAIPLLSFGQNPDGDLEVTIYSGWSFLNFEEETSLCRFCELAINPRIPFFETRRQVNGSFLFGVKAGYYLTDRAEVEGNFAIAPSHDIRIESFVNCPPGELCPLLPDFLFSDNLVAYHYDGNFTYNLTDDKVRPFLTFGVGGVSSDPGNNFGENSQTDFVLNFGGGAKFYFDKIALRFEVNDHVIPNYFFSKKTEHDLQVQYGFVFKLK